MPYPAFDRSRLKLKPLSERVHDLHLDHWLALSDPTEPFADPHLPVLAQHILAARQRGAAVIVLIGGHVIRAGVSRHLIDLLERGLITHLGMNGAAAIHDYELALIGATTESVARYIREGQFGLWQETGAINDAIVQGARDQLGLGEALGRAIAAGDFPHRDLSVLAAAYRLQVPATIHVGIGYDIIHEHPNCDGAALGAASYQDLLVLAQAILGEPPPVAIPPLPIGEQPGVRAAPPRPAGEGTGVRAAPPNAAAPAVAEAPASRAIPPLPQGATAPAVGEGTGVRAPSPNAAAPAAAEAPASRAIPPLPQGAAAPAVGEGTGVRESPPAAEASQRVGSGLEHGVLLSFGTAVMGPEVFLKALAMARNVAQQEGRDIAHFATAVFDLLPLPGDLTREARRGTPEYYFRPYKTLLVRTVAGGGESYYFRGDHRSTIPALHRLLRQGIADERR